MIAKAPGDLQAVLDAIAQKAARLCDAEDTTIRLVEGTQLQLAVHRGRISTTGVNELSVTIGRDFPMGRAVVDRQTVHVQDLAAEIDSEFPGSKTAQQSSRARTVLATPLMREGAAIGVIWIRRNEVRPFTDAQIKLLETFADQAVIAIENARLFQEREAGNRDLAALHDVTAAASQSLEIKPVLDEVVKKITDIFAFDSVSIFLFDPKKEALN